MTTPFRALIVNADDFGLSDGVNRGTIHARTHGIVTSASLMVRGAAADAAAAWARTVTGFGVGLHVDLGEWAFTAGEWRVVYEVVPLGDLDAVESEVTAQLDAFRRLMGGDPSHLDSHQHVHLEGAAGVVLAALGERLRVPVRARSDTVRYCGDFYGQTGKGDPLPDGISSEALIDVLRRVPTGVTELACHPGEGGDFDNTYTEERRVEVAVLCDPRVRAVIEDEGIELMSFSDLTPVR